MPKFLTHEPDVKIKNLSSLKLKNNVVIVDEYVSATDAEDMTIPSTIFFQLCFSEEEGGFSYSKYVTPLGYCLFQE